MRSNRGSCANFNATLYFDPNFSNSPMTQSVMQGMHLASRQLPVASSSYAILQRHAWDFRQHQPSHHVGMSISIMQSDHNIH
eukprot:scaffold2916_cov110-Skeletonema_dohrnii-CCMP3373.AAC.1